MKRILLKIYLCFNLKCVCGISLTRKTECKNSTIAVAQYHRGT
uniref:Uncharacterized protein n=1 Tax=Anguilla anguilla TaxID=7936 RepID=A0A0E9UVC0_ANGAN